MNQQSREINASLGKSGALVKLNVQGLSSIGIQVSGTFSATLQVEGSIDGSNWVSLFVAPPGTGINVTSITATGLWIGSVSGLRFVRVRCSAYTSGSANVSLVASANGLQIGTTKDANGYDIVVLGSKIFGESPSRDLMKILNNCTPGTKLSASGQVLSGTGEFYGYQCVTSSSLVIDVYDNTSGSGTKIIDTKSISAGDILAYPTGLSVVNGIYVTFASGTGSLIPYYKA